MLGIVLLIIFCLRLSASLSLPPLAVLSAPNRPNLLSLNFTGVATTPWPSTSFTVPIPSTQGGMLEIVSLGRFEPLFGKGLILSGFAELERRIRSQAHFLDAKIHKLRFPIEEWWTVYLESERPEITTMTLRDAISIVEAMRDLMLEHGAREFRAEILNKDKVDVGFCFIHIV